MDRESQLIVAEDLQYLQGWSTGASPGELRRGTAVLRRLLVEDAYGQCWRAAGFEREPTLGAVDIERAFGDKSSRLEVALAGGVKYLGAMYAIISFHRSSEPLLSASDIPNPAEGEFPFQRIYGLSEFLRSASGYAGGRPFTRREVIKYLANVKGGVHLSATERKKEAKLVDRLSKVEKRFHLRTSGHPLPVDALVLEALAIGQALARSDDANRYIAKVRGGS